MLKKILVVIGGFLLGIVAGVYWLFISVGSGQQSEIDIVQLRNLANSLPGEKPLNVRVEQVAMMTSPAWTIVAGDSFGVVKSIPIYTYQLNFPSRSIIIDTAMSREVATQSLGVEFFDDDAYGRLLAAMLQADGILVTHEHVDHMGGVFAHPRLEALSNKLLLTREQVEKPAVYAGIEQEKLRALKVAPLEFDGAMAVAPGVVLIKTPGHTPGSVMIFVQLKDAEEYLFVGDIAWHYRNIEVVKPKARIASQFVIGEAYSSVLGQIEALAKLQDKEPRLHIIPGHDVKPIQRLIDGGFIQEQFDIGEGGSIATQ